MRLDVLAAAVAVAAWVGLVAVVYLIRRPREPEPGPSTLDLGPEPPAVAGLLVHDFRLGRETVPATLLDLAARGFAELEQREPGSYVCRLTGGGDGAPTAYEARVLELLRRRVRDGIVPTQALTTGPGEQSKRWWRSFRREVVADAQARGLSRDLLDKATVTWLTAASAVPGVAVAVAARDVRAAFACMGAALVGLGAVRGALLQRDTAAGRAAAGRWLGVRERLGADEELARAAPVAVKLWERYLAYAAAFGVAPGAIEPIPMGAESDTRAWSAYGGRWRLVRVAYPRLLPIGWGLGTAGALLRGVALAGGGALVLAVVAPAALDVARDAGGHAHTIVLALLALPCAAIGAGVVLLYGAVADVWAVREVTGPVLRLRARGDDDDKRHYVAVDDGRSPRVRAWVVAPSLYAELTQDELVTAAVSRNLAHVRSIRRASAAAAAAPAAPSAQARS